MKREPAARCLKCSTPVRRDARDGQCPSCRWRLAHPVPPATYTSAASARTWVEGFRSSSGAIVQPRSTGEIERALVHCERVVDDRRFRGWPSSEEEEAAKVLRDALAERKGTVAA